MTIIKSYKANNRT